jgi:hypothetical protein
MDTIQQRGISKREASFGEILINSIHLIELIFYNSRSLSWASFSSSSLISTTPATTASTLAWVGDPCLGDAPSNCPVSKDWAVAMFYTTSTNTELSHWTSFGKITSERRRPDEHPSRPTVGECLADKQLGRHGSGRRPILQ